VTAGILTVRSDTSSRRRSTGPDAAIGEVRPDRARLDDGADAVLFRCPAPAA